MRIVYFGGGSFTDLNGRIIEDLIEERDLVCMNDRRSTRFNLTTGDESVLDLTLVSSSQLVYVAGKYGLKIL